MTDEPFGPDTVLDLGGGRTKRAGDCTRAELEAATDRMAFLGARAWAAAEAISEGRPPKCDHEYADGTFCTADAAFIRTGFSGTGPADDTGPRALCAKHNLR